MFGKVKKILGIEGVKLALEVPYEVKRTDTSLIGDIILFSKNEQIVSDIEIKMVEKYTRGRRKQKLIDEYKITDVVIHGPWIVNPDEEVVIPFELNFDLIKSDMDHFSDKNFIYSGLASFAKKIKGVKSEYRIEAEGDVEGTMLNPFDKKIIKIY